MPFLTSITSMFTGSASAKGSSSRHQARRSVMSSTNDAFSLPDVTEGRFTGMSAAQTDSASSSPGPSRRESTNYTSYPPAQGSYQPASSYYPPLSHTYHRLRNALADSFPELLETLNGPVNPALLASFERELGCILPPAVKDSLALVDGQDLEAAGQLASGGLFFGLHFLPLEEVMREWAFWRQAEHDPSTGRNPAVLATMASIPPHWIKAVYACRGWLPLLSDRTGNYVGVDLDPGQGGSWGQVIVFGRDFDRKCVLWKGEGEGGWGKWLASFVDELESGDGWEADKTSSSDEEEEAGYSSYNGGQTYGEVGSGLRLAGEYKGWNVLEAWWDRSVRGWETLNLGMDVDEIERGLSEARRLAGFDEKGKSPDHGDGMAVGMRTGESAAQVEIPVIGSPSFPPAPGTPTPQDSDVLLPPSSPDVSSHPQIPRLNHPVFPTRTITPVASSGDHPLKQSRAPSQASSVDGFLSPPSRSGPGPAPVHRRPPPPAPLALDLPTRADVQAMHAIANAEVSGLRGGWVMNVDMQNHARGLGFSTYGPDGSRRSLDGMVDVDLERGNGDKFGSPRMSDVEMERQREEEKLALAGVEHRRSPALNSRSSSPLSRNASFDMAPSNPYAASQTTPKASSYRSREEILGIGANPHENGTVPPSVIAATSALRRPPPAANLSDRAERVVSGDWSNPSTRSNSQDFVDGDRRRSAHGSEQSRMEREASVASISSDQGLLSGRSGRGTPVLASPVQSPAKLKDADGHVTQVPVVRVGDVETGMEEIRL